MLLVSHDAAFYGAQLLALYFARFVKFHLRLEVVTVLTGPGPLRAEFEKIGEVIDFTEPPWRTRPSPSVLRARQATLRSLFERGFRHVVCNTTPAACLLPLLEAEGFRTVVLVHELPVLLKQFGLEDVARNVAAMADRVVFPAAFVRDRFIALSGLDGSKAVIRPQGLFRRNPYRSQRPAARAELVQRLGLAEEAAIVVAAGPGDRRKGVDIFCQVALQVVRALPGAHFVWIGDDQTELARDCKAWIDASKLQGNVHFLGVLADPDQYARHIAAADVFLLSSREDPFPSVVLDAMTLGMPVVGFADAGGFVELLDEGAGIVVPLEDRGAMADAVLALLRKPEQAREMGRCGQGIIDTRFAFADYVHDVLRFAGLPRPKVSVIIPNYNYQRHLPQRLASVLGQTYRPHEVIFLDDHSSDDSVAVARAALAQSDIPHRIVVNASNAGCYAQWLRGLEMATGDLVWIAEADDTCQAQMLEVLVKAFDDPDVVLAYCESRKIDDDGVEFCPDYLDYTNDISPSKWRQPYKRAGTDEIRDTLAIKNTIPNASAVLMRRADLTAIRERLLAHTSAGDWLTYVHLLERGSICFSPQVLNAHRIHRQGVTRGGNAARHFGEIIRVQEYIRARHALSAETGRKIDTMRQRVFEFLQLQSPASPTYRDHPAAAEWFEVEPS
jgi:glycosyltransferase involved in cell wall biosynthesis